MYRAATVLLVIGGVTAVGVALDLGEMAAWRWRRWRRG